MITHVHFCNHCGKQFAGTHAYDYVCPDCRKKHDWRTDHNFCVRCGKPLGMITKVRSGPKGNGQITYEIKEGNTLCVACRAKPETPIIKDCPTCGTSFQAKGAKKFCSMDCRPKKAYTAVEAHRKAARRWQKSNKEKVSAQHLARYHTNELVILYECPCEAEKKYNHHPDYSRPLEVLRLCYDCHRKEHARLRALTREAI